MHHHPHLTYPHPQGLAFTSKTPGKTSEFNYFDAQGRIAATNERHRFYLVDLPGVGYAEVRITILKTLRKTPRKKGNDY